MSTQKLTAEKQPIAPIDRHDIGSQVLVVIKNDPWKSAKLLALSEDGEFAQVRTGWFDSPDWVHTASLRRVVKRLADPIDPTGNY